MMFSSQKTSQAERPEDGSRLNSSGGWGGKDGELKMCEIWGARKPEEKNCETFGLEKCEM